MVFIEPFVVSVAINANSPETVREVVSKVEKVMEPPCEEENRLPSSSRNSPINPAPEDTVPGVNGPE